MVYIELVILDNFLLDFAILVFGMRLAGMRARFLRAALGALIGGAYAALALLTPFLYGFLEKAVVFFAMTAAAVLPARPALFFRAAGWCFAVTLIFGGAVLGAVCLLGGSIDDGFVSAGFARYIFAGAAVAACVVEILLRRRRPNTVYDVTCNVCGERLRLRAFTDTGNGLTDADGDGVIIADESIVKKRLSAKALGSALARGTIFYCTTVSGCATLPGIRPDAVTVRDGRRTYTAQCAIALAVSTKPHEALFSPGIRLIKTGGRK